MKIDLYANPDAQAAQDALIASLPAPRRVEALLTSAKAGSVARVSEQVARDWQREPEACAAVVLRRSGDGGLAWPVPILAAVLAAVMQSTAKWQCYFTKDFPPDAGLFAALWARLCSDGDAAAAVLPWLLGALCARRLGGLGAEAARDACFAADAALRVAGTLAADLAVLSAAARLQAALALGAGGHATGADGGCHHSCARIASLAAAPLAALLAPLTEAAAAGPAAGAGGEAADAAAEAWLRLAGDVAGDSQDLCGARAAVREQLARFLAGLPAQRRYSRLLVSVLLPSRGPHAAAGLCAEGLLLAACLDGASAPAGAAALAALRRLDLRSGRGGIMPVLAAALSTWPTKRTSCLVLEVLPAVVDDLPVWTPTGPSAGGRVLCTAGPFDVGPVVSPAARSLHFFLCCAAAVAAARPAEAAVVLRTVVTVVRTASAEKPRGAAGSAAAAAPRQLCMMFGGFLEACASAVPGLCAAGRGTAAPPPALLAASLLLRSLARSGGRGEGGLPSDLAAASPALLHILSLSQ